MRTHLFVAPGTAAFGEVLLGMRLARELHEAGDRVIFLAPRGHHLLFEGTPFKHGDIDPVLGALDRALPEVIVNRGADSVVILDMLTMLLALRANRIDPAFLDHLPATTYALDIWDLRNSDLRFDMCESEIVLPDTARTLVPNRLVPVPFGKPDTLGAYCSLPTISEIDRRAETRAELGVGDTDRLVMLTTAKFQGRGLTPFQTRSVATIPNQIIAACLDCDPRVHVVHVGPRSLVGGSRYRHQPQVAPDRFEQLMRASDLLVTPNQSATGVSLALTLGVPSIAVIGESTEYKFRVLALGLHAFMSPILQNNPYVDVVPGVDIDALKHVVHARIFDQELRAEQRVAMRTYIDRVQHLPTGGKVLGSF